MCPRTEALGVTVSQDGGLRCEHVPAGFTVLLSVAAESAKSGALHTSLSFPLFLFLRSLLIHNILTELKIIT